MTKPSPHDTSARIELHGFWAYHAIVLADQIGRYTLSVVKTEADLNLSQWRVLAAIGEKAGRTAAEVTTLTPMDKTIVSRAVTALLNDGYVKKTPDKADKRRVALETTPAGETVYQRISETLNATLIEALPPSLSQENFIKDLQAYTEAVKRVSPKEGV